MTNAQTEARASLWVPAKPEHAKLGWTYDFEQTERISRAAYDSTGYEATMEVVEFVMAEADRRHATALAAKDAELAAVRQELGETRLVLEQTERNAERIIKMRDRDDAEYLAMKEDRNVWREKAERALAERSGGVKVKALVELERALCEFINAASDQYDPAAWILETKRNFEALSKAYSDAYSVGVFPDALTTEPAAPQEPTLLQHTEMVWTGEGPYGFSAASEGQQEAARIGDAVLDWMVKFDLLDAGNEYYVSDVLAVLNDLTPSPRPAEQAVTEARRFQLGDRVTKTKGSSWTGHVVGFYSTSLTPTGYCVESENEPGSVQIYPEAALGFADMSEAFDSDDALTAAQEASR